MPNRTLKSSLLDRELRFDGVSEVEPDKLVRFLLLGVPPSKLRVTTETPDVTQFNAQVGDDEQLKLVGSEPVQLNMEWKLPESYQSLDLGTYITDLFFSEAKQAELNYSPAQLNLAIERIAEELTEVERRGMTQLMRTLIFIIDQFKSSGVVWGVGRGSSCASYLLFLIGLHVVDCVTMEVPAAEFFHD